ncbi:MAG: radical SAM protein, partial [Clostridiales bacterium]|nr:radical SAM protein [Clostridiales bacterium]
MRELEIYIHIPFCVKKCAYCDFLSAPANRERRDRYVQTLLEEIRSGSPAGCTAYVENASRLGGASVVPPRCASADIPPEERGCHPARTGCTAHAKNASRLGGASETGDCSEYIVTSVFFGGGTPSILSVEQIAAIMDALRSRFQFREDVEITLECNPGTLVSGWSELCASSGQADMTEVPEKFNSPEKSVKSLCLKNISVDMGISETQKLASYRDCGINRLSFGLQSADNGELAALGRIHTWETFLHSYEAARKAGFTNINIDLMSALPGQTVHSWEHTLRQVLQLAPEHISAYSLIIEEGTPFYEKYLEDDRKRADGEQPQYLPSEDDERKMYALTEQMLAEAGMHRYEISNYARPGYACRHNIGYWRGIEYMGFGLGASSYLKYTTDTEGHITAVRIKKPTDHREYEKLVHAENASRLDDAVEIEVLKIDDDMSEFMILGLRMMAGVSEQE